MVEKTTKWSKKSPGKVVQFKPREKAVAEAKAEVEAEPVGKEERKIPDIRDYFPIDENGNQKSDNRKRILLMIEEDGTTFAPILWFKSNVVEANIIIAEAAKVMAVEVAHAVVKREESIGEEVDKRVATTLRALTANIAALAADSEEEV